MHFFNLSETFQSKYTGRDGRTERHTHHDELAQLKNRLKFATKLRLQFVRFGARHLGVGELEYFFAENIKLNNHILHRCHI